ncbi:MAG TPA: hypothetical protein VGB51_09195 [Actinomycetota bacterium]
MNERSVEESNALLAAAARRAAPGEEIPVSPAELAIEAGIENRLAIARAVRALLSRGRLAQEGQGYRLLDARPLEPGERASVKRPVRRRVKQEAPAAPEDDVPTYEQLGRVVIERLIEASAEAAELRAALDRARDESDSARREVVEVRRDAARDRQQAAEAVEEAAALRKRLEMTEANLREVLEAARSRPAAPMDDTDARAILDILGKRDASA